MRPSVRLLSLEASSRQASKSLYVCSTCRQEARPRPFLTQQSRRNASESAAQRWQRKLWRPGNLPGVKDPYGGEGIIGSSLRGQRQPEAEEEKAEEEQAEEEEGEGLAPADPYVPATTWDNLPRIGHLGRWSDYPPTAADTYSPFMIEPKVKKTEHLHLLGHQAAVEIAVMQSLKKPLPKICDVLQHDKSIFKMIWHCKFQSNQNGQWDQALVYPHNDAEKNLRFVFQQVGDQAEVAHAEETAVSAEEEAAEFEDAESEEIEASNPAQLNRFFGYSRIQDEGFLGLPLNDLTVKFAYLKRVSQLTGHYFPDSAIHSFTTVNQVFEYLVERLNPKPKKLAQTLASEPALQLPNVMVFTERQKRADRDEELGRKKVIDAELRARGLID